jgi:ACS family tartrate transporter-like MFS transporter
LPIAVAAGAPVSTALLGLNGLFGLSGWQVMYIAEGVPTMILGIITFLVLTDKPTQATFLTDAEKSWLTAKIATERAAKEAVKKFGFLEGMYNPKVLLLALNYFGIVVASLGILFFVPQMIKDIGVKDNMTVGWLTMIPYICGGIGLVGWGMVSDRMNERRWNLLGACAVATIGLVIAGATTGTWWSMVGLCIATFGFYGSKGPFWSMPPMFLTGTAAAASIAWINSIGNLGGFFGPWYVGVLKDWTGAYAGGIYGLAFLCLVSAVVCALFLEIPNPAAHDQTLAEGVEPAPSPAV